MELLIVGGGKMGEALLGGLLGTGTAPDQVVVVEPDAARRAALEAAYPEVAVAPAPVAAAGAVVAVKPALVPQVCDALRPHGVPRVLSIAAGVRVATIEGHLDAGTAVVRAMPNTPALIGAGVSAIAGGTTATDADLTWAATILGAVGMVVRVTEDELDAVTGLSGSGPAYLYLFVEALVDAGVALGLERVVAERLAHGTVLGAARMVTELDASPTELRADVTSPNGTTEAGIAAAEAAGLRQAVEAAVRAATERSIELGSSATKL